jgi:hypothetical protein
LWIRPSDYIQFGSPPETIKDTMRLPGACRIFRPAAELFNWIKGISVGEIEFPLYYNFFIKKKKTFILCAQETVRTDKARPSGIALRPEGTRHINRFRFCLHHLQYPQLSAMR